MGSDDDGALASYPLSGASSSELGIIKWDQWKLVELASRLLWQRVNVMTETRQWLR